MSPDEIEKMAESLNSENIEPPVTPESVENELLTEIRRIIKMADGEPDELQARYAPEYLALIYDGHEFARFEKTPGEQVWIEFDMYPALHDKYAPDPRFADVADKKEKFWRVKLSRPQEISNYKDIIIDETL